MIKMTLLVLLSITFTGCTSKDLYQVGQDYKKSECIKNAGSGSQHNDCLSSEKKSYEQYEKEREQVMKENKEKK